MRVRDLYNEPLIIEWLGTFNPSENTRKLYLQACKISPIIKVIHRMNYDRS